MLWIDRIHFSKQAILAQPGRSLLTGLGIAVGVATVVLLTAIGQGVARYVMQEFTQFGTHLLAITPGHTETLGLSGAVVSNVRPLSLEDAQAIAELPLIEAMVPFIQGNAAIEAGQRSRRSLVFGVGPATPEVWQITLANGRFLPQDAWRTARAYAVLGATLQQQLFGQRCPLGERIRIGGERFRVLGCLQAKGQMLGFDLDDSVYIPVGRAIALFNREGLMEIDVLYHPDASPSEVADRIDQLMRKRHGRQDFTLVTQDQMLQVLSSVLDILTMAIAALGGISLLVGSIGILTVMTISVQERRGEIGLLRALGTSRNTVMQLFLTEAAMLGLAGGLVGLLIGALLGATIGLWLPQLPTSIHWFYAILSLLIAILAGLIAGVRPALRAADLNPIDALNSD